MIRVGLVGLPNAGKSTLFNFLTGAEALIAPYPFSTVTPNKANLKFYDKTADDLALAVKAPDVLRTEVEVWDIAGLIENASQGEGLGNEFLGQIKDCDVIVHVVRVTKDSTPDSIAADLRTVLTEVALFDHKCLLKPFEKARRMARLYPGSTSHMRADHVFSKAYYGTQEGKLAADVVTDKELDELREVGLVSTKPRIVLFNVDTTDTEAITGIRSPDLSENLLELSALLSMSAEERAFLGYDDEPIRRFLEQYCQQLLEKGRAKRFYTVGHLGVGQWVIGVDADAKNCSQLVHGELSDMLKGVKVARPADFMQCISWQSVTKQGLARKYGPGYIPHDGDVLYFETT